MSKPTRRFAMMLIIGSLVSSFAGLSSAYQPAPYSGHPAVRVVPCTKTAHTRPSRSQAPAPAVNATAVSSSQACAALMVWPVTHPMVIKHFEQPSRLWSSRHRGVDLAAQPGDVIMAPASGTVRFSGDVAEKSVVSIEHDTGFISTFEPAITQLPVGTPVQRREIIGTIQGISDHCGSSCLHWGVKTQAGEERYVDPESLVVQRSIDLKPES